MFSRIHSGPGPLRIASEDLLKAIVHQDRLETRWNVRDFLDVIRLPREDAVLELLVREGMISSAAGSGWMLTAKGRERAVELLRAHRLLETFFARRGEGTAGLHSEADKAEHLLGTEEINALADSLNRPRFDPHGDPIPPRAAEFSPPRPVCLRDWPPGTTALIAHVEDEPVEDFILLNGLGLVPELPVSVLGHSETESLLLVAGERISIPARAAAHVQVGPLPEGGPSPGELRRLSTLRDGEAAVVEFLSPACMGPERRRLLDLGLVPGSRVQREFSSPMGSPVAYAVRGAVIALRESQARNIFIRSTRP